MRLAVSLLVVLVLLMPPAVPAAHASAGAAPRLPLAPPSLAAPARPAETMLRERPTIDAMVAAAGLTGAIEHAVPFGDITGDGRPDVLSIAEDKATGAFSLSGVGGVDGATRWTTPVSVPYAIGVTTSPDLDGDGAADALVQTLTIDHQGSTLVCPLLCVGEAHASYHWVVELVSGATGAVDWQRTIPGGIEDVVVGTESWEATNETVIASVGAGDIVIDRYDVDSASGLLLAASHAEAVDASGATRLARSLGLSADFGILLPAAPDALLWERDENALVAQTAIDLELVAASDGATRWQAKDDVLGPVLSEPALADLTGDGAPDIFLAELGSPDSFGLVSGADGALLWNGSPGDPYVLGAGLVLGLEVTSDGIDRHYVAHRVDATTGATLFTTTPFLGEQSGSFTTLGLEGDVDGDGVGDIVLNHQYFERQYNESVLVESGRTGAALLREDAPGIWFLAPAGDIDGDGAADLHRISLTFTYDLDLGVLTAFTFGDEARTLASPLWWRNETFPDMPGLALYPAGDAVGDPRHDILFDAADRAGTTYGSRVLMLDGADGSTSWARGALPG